MQSGYLVTLSFFSFHLKSYRIHFTGSYDGKSNERDVALSGGKKHEQIESLKANLIANFYKSKK